MYVVVKLKNAQIIILLFRTMLWSKERLIAKAERLRRDVCE